MNMNYEDMTLEELFCAEAGITSDKEYDEYIEKMMQDYEAADAPFAYFPTDEEIEEMYVNYCTAEATRGTAVDYGKYDCAGFDLSDY